MKGFDRQTDYNYKEMRAAILIWLEKKLDEQAVEWLKTTGEKLANNPEDWLLYTSFSAVPRHTGKQVLTFSADEMEKAKSIRKNWEPIDWSADQLGRVFLMLNFAKNGKNEFLEKIEKIFLTSDMGEAVALYKGIPLYPCQEEFKKRAAEGIRSNMTTVFNAVAHHNPYPAEYMDEGAWNQVVLKALFVESSLYKIIGLDERANKTLAKILVEYAHERWSAGREVSPELWRPVGPFIDDEYSDDIQKVLNHPDKTHKQAALLALEKSDFSGRDNLLENHKDLVNEMEENNIGWDDIGKEVEED
ncbi:MAG: EboA domain-containing protein [Balneolaceae bacterium]|nr:EboA domain-containing protein [Balneolaceae bacterium]